MVKVVEGVIEEYDLECAGLSTLISKGLITEELFYELKECDKKTRNIILGKAQIGNEEMKTQIQEGIKESMGVLIDSLSSKNSILEVSKDAIFVLNDKPSIDKISEFVTFVSKGRYSLLIEFPMKIGSNTMIKLYKNREELRIRYSTLNLEHIAYPLLCELLNHRINNNTKLYFRTLHKIKPLITKSEVELIKHVDNNYLYSILEEII